MQTVQTPSYAKLYGTSLCASLFMFIQPSVTIIHSYVCLDYDSKSTARVDSLSLSHPVNQTGVASRHSLRKRTHETRRCERGCIRVTALGCLDLRQVRPNHALPHLVLPDLIIVLSSLSFALSSLHALLSLSFLFFPTSFTFCTARYTPHSAHQMCFSKTYKA